MKKFKKVYIEITNICNLSCSFCPPSLRKKQAMKYDEFERIIKEIKPHTEHIYLHVKGEPLLHEELDKILLLCEKNKIIINLVTNGRLIKNKKDILLNSKILRQINISLHSFINKEDLNKYIDDILNFTKEIISNDVIVSYRFWNIGNKNNVNIEIFNKIKKKFNLDDGVYEKILSEKSIKLYTNLYINKDNQFEWPSLYNGIINDKGFCYGLKDQIAILVDGTVVPCCLDSEGIVNLGNIFIENFIDIINKDRSLKIIKEFSNNKVVEELCKRCSYKERFTKNC